MDNLINAYLESKQYAWSESTKRSERHRLYSLGVRLYSSPVQLWEALSNKGPYTRVTTWTRVVDFWDWAIENGKSDVQKNTYKQWRKENARLFKNCYSKKLPTISYEEARKRILTIRDPAIKIKSLQLLEGGLRYNESNTLHDGTVIGKGNKPRRVYVSSGPIGVGYRTLSRTLSGLGLSPHMLRKIFATEMVRLGATEFQLCKVMGWESIATASSYVKADDKQIALLIEKIQQKAS